VGHHGAFYSPVAVKLAKMAPKKYGDRVALEHVPVV
jgi:hypothetical protein